LDSRDFHELVSGRRAGVGAALTRAGLRLAEAPYTLATRLRNVAFDRGWKPTLHVPVPVVSVGNITTGGTGKTPMVAWLARWFRERNVRLAIVSRGYGAQHGHMNDEGIELEQMLPDVPHVQQPDRVAGALMAIEEFTSQLILLDDGFQHRRLARDFDLVLIDALEPFGYGHVLPRGLLRESLAGLGRAQAIALSRADLVDAATRERIRATVCRYAPQAIWLEATHRPATLLNSLSESAPLTVLTTGRWGAFCGIGNPEGFRRTLEGCDCQLAAWRTFPDHHAYARADVESLALWARQERLTGLVCTRKDLVKLSTDRLGDAPLWAVQIGLELTEGGELLAERLSPIANAALQIHTDDD
jgi:tetraacyldisaccharide 4'-kinase